MCISSVQQLNEDSIEFFLSTQTRSNSKISQSKSLHWVGLYIVFYYQVCATSLLWSVYIGEQW